MAYINSSSSLPCPSPVSSPFWPLHWQTCASNTVSVHYFPSQHCYCCNVHENGGGGLLHHWGHYYASAHADTLAYLEDKIRLLATQSTVAYFLAHYLTNHTQLLLFLAFMVLYLTLMCLLASRLQPLPLLAFLYSFLFKILLPILSQFLQSTFGHTPNSLLSPSRPQMLQVSSFFNSLLICKI